MDLLEREAALTTLTGAWDRAAHGDGRAVIVSGEPGIGKTSLVRAFVRGLGPDARVLLGACDDLSTPRPLGAIRDVLGSTAPALRTAIETGAPGHEIHHLLIAELERAPRPTVLAIEDAHWADDATLDAISVIGRRIGSLPAVLLVTLRAGEVGPDHPLHAALGAIPSSDAIDLHLEPLSPDAVARLARNVDPTTVHRLTGGNPFYVSELLAAQPAIGLPPSVATAVLARASRLEPAARELLDLVAMVPGRIPTDLLATLRPDWPAAAEEPERRQILEVDPRHVRYRHELARHAIASSVPAARKRRLHEEILEALLARDADPADIVHHAEAAGAEEVVATYVLVAARRAASLASNRQAFAHYQRAAETAASRPPEERGVIFEELAGAAYLALRLDIAFPAIQRAIATYQGIGDQVSVARCTRILSRLHWYAGDGDAAHAAAQQAIDILEPLGDSIELARTYSAVSQLAMLDEEIDETVAWGQRALDLADRLGQDSIRVHAMINIGTARMVADPDATADLLEAHELAAKLLDHHEATRALVNLAYSLMTWVRPREGLAVARRALAYAEAREVDALTRYIQLIIGRIRLRAGEWSEAEELARQGLGQSAGVAELLGYTILAELASRRGDRDARDRVASLLERAKRTGEPQRIEPPLEFQAMSALLDGGAPPADELRALLGRLRPKSRFRTRVRAWMSISGLERYPDETADTPHAALARGDWQVAADGFGEAGWPYDRAIALLLVDGEDSLGEALEIGRQLGAAPLVRRASERLRVRGFAVPRGRRPATRSNVAGLTAREQEVLDLLVEGLTNAEIADRLVLSRRTAEHHVTAVLGKLGAATRREAVERAAGFGLATVSDG